MKKRSSSPLSSGAFSSSHHDEKNQRDLASLELPQYRIQLAAACREFPVQLYRFCDTLEVLDLSNNQLSELPEDFWRFKRLKRLFLTNNCFTAVPKVLAQCPELIMVSFKGNRLTEFAEGTLPTSLQWLILTDNQLTALPEDFGRYQQLQKLALAGNQLEALPASMQQCQELGLLRLALNRFSSFPDWLFRLPKLAWLALGGNPACPVPTPHETAVPQWPVSALQYHEQLGQGASGIIYRVSLNTACSTLPANHFALKEFKGSITSDGCPTEELQNYLNAGPHENLIPIIATLVGASTPGFVMALLPSGCRSLGLPPSFDTITRDTFAKGTVVELSQLLAWSQQLAAVLAHLHQKDILHGDLYAHNIMIRQDEHLLLGDFGAATALNRLPLWQQQQAKSLEIRAFGYFLADLLALLPPSQGKTPLATQFEQIMLQCFATEPTERPTAEQLRVFLQQLVYQS